MHQNKYYAVDAWTILSYRPTNNNNNNNNTQLVTRHMSVNAYSYIYERTESQARTGGLSVTVGFIVQMSLKLFFERLLKIIMSNLMKYKLETHVKINFSFY